MFYEFFWIGEILAKTCRAWRLSSFCNALCKNSVKRRHIPSKTLEHRTNLSFLIYKNIFMNEINDLQTPNPQNPVLYVKVKN